MEKMVKRGVPLHLPAKWDHVGAIYLQNKSDIADVKSAEVHQAIIAEFDRTSRGERQRAHQISTIKRKGEHPKFKESAPTNNNNSYKAKGDHQGSSYKKTQHGGCKNKGKGKAAHLTERSLLENVQHN